jgi:ribosomal protein S18 acetylase RimI-like enzyme
MSLVIREMRVDEADAVAQMVHGLAEHIGTDFVPKLTGEALLNARDLIDVVVAEDGGKLIGACLGLMTFSTWRGARGLYIVDLFITPQARGRNVGQMLLRLSARRAVARGASFIKLEVDETNTGAERFYARLGFKKKTEDRLHILEQDRLDQFISMGDGK